MSSSTSKHIFEHNAAMSNSANTSNEIIDPRVLKRFDICQKIGQGAYGVVWKAVHRKTGNIVALKKCYDAFRCDTDAQRTYREVMYLKALSSSSSSLLQKSNNEEQSETGHPNIVKLLSLVRATKGNNADHESTSTIATSQDFYVTFEYMETDLSQVIKAHILEPKHIQYVTYQLLCALKYLHSAKLLHRDIKPSNILIDSNCSIKICDFGLCRSIASDTNTPLESLILTDYIATRWYRSPEILMGSRRYTEGIDLWSVGCIIGEMYRSRPLLPGASSMAQVERIFELTGNPTAMDIKSWQSQFATAMLDNVKAKCRVRLDELCHNLPCDAKHLIKCLLKLDPTKRGTASSALEHDYVSDFHKNPEKEIVYPHGPIQLPIDDCTKMKADEYRRQLYLNMDDENGDKKKRATTNGDSGVALVERPTTVSYDSLDYSR